MILDHLNNIEEGIIEFTKEDEENDTLPVLDLFKIARTSIWYGIQTWQ